MKPPSAHLRAERLGESRFQWSITGVVRSAQGVLLAEADICAVGVSTEAQSSTRCEPADADGRFMLRGTSSPPTELLASAHGHVSRRQPLTGRQHESRMEFILQPSDELGVTGVVLDATGGPVAGALITASAPEIGGQVVAAGRSDENGQFAVQTSSGPWVLTATAQAYSSSLRRVTAPAQSQILTLVPASVITGQVVEVGTHLAVVGIAVSARSEDGLRSSPAPALSGEDGTFRFDSVAAGRYVLEVRTPSYHGAPREVAVEIGAASEHVELQVSEATWLKAAVSTASGACPGGHVELLGPVSLISPISADGQVQIDGIPPGRYRAMVRCVRGLELVEELAIDSEPVEHAWRIESGLSLVGIVKQSDGSPLPGARVAVDSRNVGADQSSREASYIHATCVAGGDGRFECNGLLEGDYTCRLQNEVSPEIVAVDVSLRADKPVSVVLQAPALGTIRVLPEEGGALPESALHALAVHVGTHQELEARRAGLELVFAGVPLGTYSVFTSPPDLGGEELAEVTLRRDGDVVDIRVRGVGASTISGRVVDDRGMPVLDAWVSVEGTDDPSATSQPVLSDEFGQFSISGLWPGRFTVKATSSRDVAETHGVSSGARDVLVRLERLGSVSGSVQTETGAAVTAFAVQWLHDATSGGRAIGGDGHFSLVRLRPGSYSMNFESSAGGARIGNLRVGPGQAVQVAVTVRPGSMAQGDSSAAAELHAFGQE